MINTHVTMIAAACLTIAAFGLGSVAPSAAGTGGSYSMPSRGSSGGGGGSGPDTCSAACGVGAVLPPKGAKTKPDCVPGSDGPGSVLHMKQVDCVPPTGYLRPQVGRSTPGTGTGDDNAALEDDCDAQLGHLRDVSAREVRSVDQSDSVRLIPICDALHRSLTQKPAHLALHGNAASLIPAIANNSTLHGTLKRARYNPEDVVGITMGRDIVLLYVHKQ